MLRINLNESCLDGSCKVIFLFDYVALGFIPFLLQLSLYFLRITTSFYVVGGYTFTSQHSSYSDNPFSIFLFWVCLYAFEMKNKQTFAK
ncbi:hypothetical protein L1887_04661 [Cichorium endivia]|nr:hypothetical protein L1887_04661 [Cichorium endivia]